MKPTFLARTTDINKSKEALSIFDNNIEKSLDNIINKIPSLGAINLSTRREIISLPINKGGLGLTRISDISYAAFTASNLLSIKKMIINNTIDVKYIKNNNLSTNNLDKIFNIISDSEKLLNNNNNNNNNDNNKNNNNNKNNIYEIIKNNNNNKNYECLVLNDNNSFIPTQKELSRSIFNNYNTKILENLSNENKRSLTFFKSAASDKDTGLPLFSGMSKDPNINLNDNIFTNFLKDRLLLHPTKNTFTMNCCVSRKINDPFHHLHCQNIKVTGTRGTLHAEINEMFKQTIQKMFSSKDGSFISTKETKLNSDKIEDPDTKNIRADGTIHFNDNVDYIYDLSIVDITANSVFNNSSIGSASSSREKCKDNHYKKDLSDAAKINKIFYPIFDITGAQNKTFDDLVYMLSKRYDNVPQRWKYFKRIITSILAKVRYNRLILCNNSASYHEKLTQ